MKNQKVLPKDGFKKLLKNKSMFGFYGDGSLLAQIKEQNLCVDKLYNGFVKFQELLEILSPKDYIEKYGFEEFNKDVKGIWSYDGCWFEFNGIDDCWIGLGNCDIVSDVNDCELQLFINHYICARS